ncbi:MAG: metabolite traffic protein EboE [Planctomycetota bacterium]
MIANQPPLSYCTNVHAGIDLDSIEGNLDQFATEVRQRLAESHGIARLGVGLWIPDLASRQLTGSRLDAFKEFIESRQFEALTINGFPFDNFHGQHVKQRVYLPTWAEADRLDYTCRLAEILSAILPAEQMLGSISTLPLGWPDNPFADSPSEGKQPITEVAGSKLRELARFLKSLHERCGKKIVVAIEPEPGCWLDTADDVIQFFDRELADAKDRDYISVCHDICHSVVMNESQRDVLRRYKNAGVPIGKVQVSSAIVVPWDEIDVSEHAVTLKQLREFAEDRYLHQTGRIDQSGHFDLSEDLPDLLRSVDDPASPITDRSWRIHFHVPIFLESFGRLKTSRSAVLDCVEALSEPDIEANFTGHLEVETYAWTVLPPEWRQRGLAADIAGEVGWLQDQLSVQVSKNRAKR